LEDLRFLPASGQCQGQQVKEGRAQRSQRLPLVLFLAETPSVTADPRNGFLFAPCDAAVGRFPPVGGGSLYARSVVPTIVLLAPSLVPPSTIRLSPFRLLASAPEVAHACT